MAISVLSAITVPAPVNNNDAVTKLYSDREATTESAGVVTLADSSAAPSYNAGKVPVLDETGKLSLSVIPTSISTGATAARVTSFGGQTGPIDVDSYYFRVRAASDSTEGHTDATLTLAYDTNYFAYSPGIGLSLSTGVRTTLTNAAHLYFMVGSNNNEGASPISYAGSDYKYYSPDAYVTWWVGGEELPEASYLVGQESIAASFAVNTTYSVGQIVSYAGWLYRCVSSTSVFEFESAWENWERVTLIDDAGQINPYLVSSYLGSVIPAFDATKKYSVGAFVSYNGKFYKCTTAVTTVGSFTAGNWTEVSLTSNKTTTSSGVTTINSTTFDTELMPTGTGNGSGDSGKVAKLDSYSRIVGFNNNRQYLSATTLTASSKTLSDQYNGWRLLIKSTVSPGTLTLPSPSLTENMYATYELYVVCMGSTSNSVTLSFSNAVSFEDGSSSSVSLQRGYAYFMVARHFPCLTASSTDSSQSWTNWKWVFNIQGKIALPTS